jgi:hypothetical protein
VNETPFWDGITGGDGMTVALVVNGVPNVQLSMADGLRSLQLLLTDRQTNGCTIAPTEAASCGTQYRIQHPGAGVELVFLTDYPDPDNPDWDSSG